MLLRVVLCETDIRRLSIENTPQSVEELCEVLRANLSLRGGFILQFEDPAFKDQLTNLTDIRDLPEERATLKVLFTADAALSVSTLDTASLPSLSSGESDSQQWPDPFPIPQFSHDVELTLQEANRRHAKDGSVMVIPKGMKTDILDTLADSMSKISPYPERQHYENVAKALVEKHASLKEPGSGMGWYGWFHSLKFKLGNYRQKLSAAGCPEVRVNKRIGEDAKGSRVKKSKKGEVHYCPDPPEGLSAEDMEGKRRMIEVEMLKKDLDHQRIEELMSATFSKRRKEIVGDQPLIGDVMTRWPAMFCERQIRAEFKRIVSTDLLESFLNGLDDLVPRLLEVYEAVTKSGKKPALKAILDCVKKDNTNERRRTAALLGLPHYLSEDPSDIIRMCDAHGESLAAAMKGMQLGLRR
ncbi:uncharacterized protein LOC130381706 [Gadus chalcogrammus]|uniref:uncharacterized protein LOC130381706 n=1 Tax=Gadus chalcogrammus TaxID=1042646 RepID=UPI0024C23E53|nr:uncharacterized protein LOC130381706 [Gadus chalcogrammus]